MRRFKGAILAGMLILGMSVPVYADKSAVVKVEAPEDTTDYYMTVDSGGVGVDIYPSTDGKGEKLNDKTVEDGTVLHIEGETDKNGETWGYTEYKGRYGYVPLDELRPSRDAELAAKGITTDEKKSSDGSGQNGNGETGTQVTESAGNTEQNGTAGAAEATVTGDNAGEVQGPPAGTEGARDTEGEVQGPPAGNTSSDSTEEASEDEDPSGKDTKPVNGTAAKSFKTDSTNTVTPFIVIGILTVIAAAGILIAHRRKK